MPMQPPMPMRPPLTTGARPRLAAPWVGLALLAPLLAACGNSSDVRVAPACPQLAIVKEAADLVRTNGRGQDITDLVLDARITAVPASCKLGPKNTVEAELRVAVELVRGPAAQGRRVNVPYFIAVTDSQDRLLDKQEYSFQGDFPVNVDRVNTAGQPVTLAIPTSAERPASSFRVYVGFALTPEEVAANRARAR